MAGLNQFTGSPWHVEKWTRREGDPRRHRSRCKYYYKSTGRCGQINSNCFGAAHCEYYKERPVSEGSIKGSDVNWRPKKRRVSKYAKSNKTKDPTAKKKTITVGSIVNDKTYGKGTVKSIYNGLAVVSFDGAGDVLINMNTNEKSGVLKRIEKNKGKWSSNS